jgi:hypothetical protein
VSSARTLHALAEGAGLEWVSAQPVGGEGATASVAVSGPALADGSPYVMVTLRKPG